MKDSHTCTTEAANEEPQLEDDILPRTASAVVRANQAALVVSGKKDHGERSSSSMILELLDDRTAAAGLLMKNNRPQIRHLAEEPSDLLLRRFASAVDYKDRRPNGRRRWSRHFGRDFACLLLK
jgi:hypothetical protein